MHTQAPHHVLRSSFTKQHPKTAERTVEVPHAPLCGSLLTRPRRLAQVVTWICDPMHGNTECVNNFKTRRYENIRAEVEAFFDVHDECGECWPQLKVIHYMRRHFIVYLRRCLKMRKRLSAACLVDRSLVHLHAQHLHLLLLPLLVHDYCCCRSLAGFCLAMHVSHYPCFL